MRTNSDMLTDSDLAGIYLVAVTGYGTEADREQTRAAGFDVHLAKPVDPHEVEALLTARDA